MQKKRNWTWLRMIALCFLMAVVIAIPASTINAQVKSTTSKKTLLKYSITYCDKMDESKYTAKSWKAFQKELKAAKAVYKKAKQTDKDYIAAKEKLEKVKANLAFIASTDKGNPNPFRQLTVKDIVNDMGAGWNLGNTMDGHDSAWFPAETSWQKVITTKAAIKSVHDMGFNTIRVPVTWGTKVDDKNNYKIDEAWMNRVQDIIDYAISEDMYVIVNIHHDGVGDQGGWLNAGADQIDLVYEKFEQVWRQIAERFKDYDEHLIFEDMNEVGYSDYFTDTAIVMNFNQIFVNVVRSTGSNNTDRWLSVPSRQTNIELASNPFYGFEMPKDTVKNRLFVAVHHYDNSLSFPESKNSTKFTSISVPALIEKFKQMNDTFSSKGIPVILGEYGAVNKNNTIDRAYYYEVISRICKMYGIVACAWDDGYHDPNLSPDLDFAIIDRTECKSLYPAITDSIMRGTYLPVAKKDLSDLSSNPTITKITELTLSNNTLSMSVGDIKDIKATVKPSKTNDVVLWKTEDPAVATVSNGHVRARGLGTTKLTAFTQSGSVKQEVTVTVNIKQVKKPFTSITTDAESYSVAVGSNVFVKVTKVPADSDDFLTYKSSDESVATVSSIGKIVGCKEGTAEVTVYSASGLFKTVKVAVTASK